jgi:hypothetical protein
LNDDGADQVHEHPYSAKPCSETSPFELFDSWTEAGGLQQTDRLIENFVMLSVLTNAAKGGATGS